MPYSISVARFASRHRVPNGPGLSTFLNAMASHALSALRAAAKSYGFVTTSSKFRMTLAVVAYAAKSV